MTSQRITSTTPEMNAATTWDLDPAHSAAEFSVRHMMIATVRGALAVKGGTLEWNARDPTRSHITAELDAASIHTGAADRDAHLRSADFLDAEKHPVVRFESERIEALGDERYRIHGHLTIRGTTRAVVLDAEKEGEAADPWGNQRVAVTANTTIDRSDWDLTWNQALEAGGFLVGDKLKIALHVQAVRRG